MAHQQAQTELLKLTLAHLHRIEGRMAEINDRLGSIELSMASIQLQGSDAGAQDCFVEQHQHPSASSYLASTERLSNEFAVSASVPTHHLMVEADSYSLSVYPTRPPSRLDLSGVGLSLHGLPGPPALRYEDTPIAVTQTPQRNDEATSTRSQTSGRKSTARTSFSSWRRRSTLSSLRTSIRRSSSMRTTSTKSGRSKTPEMSVDENSDGKLVRQESLLDRCALRMHKSARTCVDVVPKMLGAVGRGMVNQQFKSMAAVN